jgi:prolyl oligopeptidase
MRSVLETPPVAPIEPVTDVLHGVESIDPCRWLEDQNTPRTRKWIEEQTAYTRCYFDAIPGRDHLRKRIEELLTAKDVISEPRNVGDGYFFLKGQEDSEQRVIVMRDGLFRGDNVLVDTR